MKVISVINLKGGVGKTFTTIQMGYYLYRSGYKVLLIDNDKQGNLSKFYRVYANTDECAAAKMLSPAPQELSNLASPTWYTTQNIIGANMSLLTATLAATKTAAGDQHLRYKRITEQAKRAGYDYVLIDNPPDMGLNVINALMVTDDVIVPLKIDEWALEGLDIIVEQVNTARALNSGIRLAGTLITNYRNNDANVAGVEWLHANGYKVFHSRIRHSDKATESIFFHQPVQVYSPRSAAAIDYKVFMREYLGEKGGRKYGTTKKV